MFKLTIYQKKRKKKWQICHFLVLKCLKQIYVKSHILLTVGDGAQGKWSLCPWKTLQIQAKHVSAINTSEIVIIETSNKVLKLRHFVPSRLSLVAGVTSGVIFLSAYGACFSWPAESPG